MRFPCGLLLTATILASPAPVAAQCDGRDAVGVVHLDTPGIRASTASARTIPGIAQVPASFMSAAMMRPPSRKRQVGVRGYVLVEAENLKATQSFNAVLGASRLTGTGAGVDVVNLWKGAFARFTRARATKEGTRVFIDSSQQVVSLHIPLTVTMTPVEVGGGWRFAPLDPNGHLVPYFGAALLWLGYKETSQFAEAGEDTDATFKGHAIFAGLEVGFGRVVNVAIEGLYRRVPLAIGAGGVSSTFNETDLGGRVLRFRFGVGF